MTNKKLPELTTRQKQYLKGLAHALSPVVLLGKEELTPGVVETIKTELLRHELIKVKIGNNCGLEKHSTSTLLAERTSSILVQLIGKTIVLYRPNPERDKDTRITLPPIK